MSLTSSSWDGVRYITQAKHKDLYKIAKAEPDATGFVDGYHPSYTFKYGNSTDIGELGKQQSHCLC